jgi:hypothetical protein
MGQHGLRQIHNFHALLRCQLFQSFILEPKAKDKLALVCQHLDKAC